MKKQAFFALAVIAAAGCSTGTQGSDTAPASEAPAEGVTSAQLQAFKGLELTTEQRWSWLQHEKFKTPMHLGGSRSGAAVLRKGADAQKTTLGFLEEHKALFRMRAPDAELRMQKAETDELGMTHVRFQQITHGVPVVGAELMAHYDKAGHVASIDANYVPDLDGVDVDPKIDAKTGLKTVTADILARTADITESQLEPNEGKLVVFALGDGPAKLAYEYKVRAIAGSDPAIWVTTVDAKTGAIIDQYNDLQTVEASGQGITGQQKFQVTEQAGAYVMTDTTGGVAIRTYTAQNQQTNPGTAVTSDTLTTWDTGVAGAGAAVDAHAYASIVFKYYKEKHQRNAIDGKGGAMVSTAHFGQAYDNAFWDGTGMSYGDGGTMFKPLSAGLDVVAHEFSHGVTEGTSALRYQGQSGALNEAFSDIISSFVEHYHTADDAKNWVLGENVGTSGPLRDMKTPGNGQQPAAMTQFRQTTQDNGGVHINSGIVNNAAYLMTAGGVNPATKTEVKFGIGWDKSEKLWYRANTKYFLATTNFGQAAQGLLSAAKDVGLTENETNIVDCAWKATGVSQGACANLTNPQSTPGTDPSDPTNPPGTGGDGTGDGTEDGSEDGTPATKRRTRSLPQDNAGCNASGSSADFGGFAGVLAALLGLALGRRKRS